MIGWHRYHRPSARQPGPGRMVWPLAAAGVALCVSVGASSQVTVSMGSTPPPDITPPAVSLTFPPSGSTVSGTFTIAADASDEVGVAGVQFRLDGTDLGAEDTSPPYSIWWSTTLVPDGQYTLTAVARDAAGNTRRRPP